LKCVFLAALLCTVKSVACYSLYYLAQRFFPSCCCYRLAEPTHYQSITNSLITSPRCPVWLCSVLSQSRALKCSFWTRKKSSNGNAQKAGCINGISTIMSKHNILKL
uniref:Chemokine interleukin-8-like domain-containing protein n=1 Tax=Cyprinodon variegatus TaxID=28743 RepID=A0A3Q2DJL4_CYPVA